MSATIKDIAKETNLALSTISKYINGGNVRAENKKLIDDAIRKLNFVPSNTARGLRSAKTYRVGLISGSPDNPHNARLLSEIEAKMHASGYSLLFMNRDMYDKNIERIIQQMLRSGVDGIIVTSLGVLNGSASFSSTLNIPIVELEEGNQVGQFDYVQTSCTRGAYDLTEHLIQMGHTRIAAICGIKASTTAAERKRGFLRAMEDYGISVNPDYVISGGYDSKFGYASMQKLWKLSKRPTAVFFSNYNICLGAYEAIHDLGICIPDELSTIAFDDFELSMMLSPHLTAVRQPLKELAGVACDILLRRMNGDYSDFPRRIRLKPQCFYRESVANLLVSDK